MRMIPGILHHRLLEASVACNLTLFSLLLKEREDLSGAAEP
jgi:hypothetical protein